MHLEVHDGLVELGLILADRDDARHRAGAARAVPDPARRSVRPRARARPGDARVRSRARARRSSACCRRSSTAPPSSPRSAICARARVRSARSPIGLVVATTVGVAVVSHTFVDGLSWGSAFVLGAIVSPTDPLAATSIARRLGVPRKLVTIVEGESLVNDGTGLVAYRVAVVAVDLGVVLGCAGGWAVRRQRRRRRRRRPGGRLARAAAPASPRQPARGDHDLAPHRLPRVHPRRASSASRPCSPP